MSLLRTIIIRGPEQVQALVAFVNQNALPMAKRGEFMEIKASVYKATASNEQRNLIWLVNQQIAEQAWVGGRQYDAETWHEHSKRELLPEKTAKGKAKWRFLPDGSRALALSTQDLNRSEKSLYIDQLIAWATTELGVQVEIQERAAAWS